MTYETIPSFSNLDYKADIRDKVFKPLISQHNEHSVALEALNPLPAYAEELKELAHDTPKIRNLVAHGDEIIDLSLQSKDIMQLANEAGIISGLDGRVTALEIRRLNESYLQEEGSGGDGSADLTELTNRVDSAEQEIDSLKPRLSRAESDISTLESKVEALELGGGSGEGGSVDLSPVLEKISALEDEDVAINAEVAKLKTEDNKLKIRVTDAEASVADHESRIHDLENVTVIPPSGGSGEAEPTKFYILPLAGQSNMVGYARWNEKAENHPRLKQLGRHNNLPESATAYGDLHDVMRPFNGQCNMEIIPAAPALDFNEELFTVMASSWLVPNKPGGTPGAGYFIARRLLDYIPKDYGIICIPVGWGNTGFYNNGRWRVGRDLANDLKSRIVHCLKLNPENRLLPTVWIQGEYDSISQNGAGSCTYHQSEFLRLFNDIKDTLVAEKLDKQIASLTPDDVNQAEDGYAPIEDFRWISVGSTKWMLGAVGHKHIDETFPMEHAANRLSVYDNYVYLMNTIKSTSGQSQILYARGDIGPDGVFLPTEREESYGENLMGGEEEIHFAPTTYMHALPAIVEAVMLGHGRCLYGPKESHFNYPMKGCNALTDGAKVYHPFAADASGIPAPVVNEVITADKAITLSDNFTICFKYQLDKSIRETSQAIIETAGSWILAMKDGTLVSYRGPRSADCVPLSPCINGAWEGDFDDFQHISITYNSDFRLFNAYVNGKLVASISDSDGFSGAATVNKLGNVGNLRVYSTDLSKGQVAAIYLKDR